MSPSLRALLEGAIDYAGLFPPAKLPFDEAIRNYARYRAEPESWMLGRFICPVARLAELEPALETLFRTGPPLRISALCRGGETAEELLANYRADVEAMRLLRTRFSQRVHFDALEIRIPAAWFPLVEPDSVSVLDIALTLGMLDFQDLNPFIEGDFSTDPFKLTGKEVEFIYEMNTFNLLLNDSHHCEPVGFKLRCGGLEPSAFPSPGAVASALYFCRRAEVPLKLTAGLHHPIRHYDKVIGTPMHGFLNVFGAGVLGYAHRLEGAQLWEIIEDEDPASFRFDEDSFQWRDLRASINEIAAARKNAIISFGSCSFDEPREDLRALGLLP